MKGSIIALSFAAFLVLSFTEINADPFDDLCGIPENTRNIILQCAVDSLDDRSKRDVQRVEACAGYSVIDALNSICTNPHSEAVLKFAECEEQLGVGAPNIDREKAVRCVRYRLG